ncbi:CPBP family intramembrane glutamic endopeptidase [uncultured Sphingomonas sp.]|uniref:CPBP family intramembrane glutamic endopeptidase n=1 Tax=uncultured Sphingomonas sp. TaxID=158754 RepID=UPI0030DAABCD
MIAFVALAAALGALWAYLRGGVLPARWGPVRRGPARRILRQCGWFGATTLAVLALTGRWPALVALPPEFVPVRAATIRLAGGTLRVDAGTLWVLGGIVLGGALLALAERWRGRPLGLGDVEGVMPRTLRDLAWSVPLSVSAGVNEEAFFRLLLPLAIAWVTGSALAGFAVATVLFGAAHRYQGWRGVTATAISGALLAFVYLLAGQLWVAISLHIAIDLNALVLRPLLSGRVRW